jgi:hypothetical protein
MFSRDAQRSAPLRVAAKREKGPSRWRQGNPAIVRGFFSLLQGDGGLGTADFAAFAWRAQDSPYWSE